MHPSRGEQPPCLRDQFDLVQVCSQKSGTNFLSVQVHKVHALFVQAVRSAAPLEEHILSLRHAGNVQ